MTTNELKPGTPLPCPCCDHEAAIVPHVVIKRIRFRVECSNEGCGLKTNSFNVSNEAIAAWNTRTPDLTLTAERDRLGMDSATIKSIWREHGGSQHGPMVETYTIEEQAFYRFARALLARALTQGAA